MSIVSPIILLVGLGNPGTQYSLTRHNVGFMAIDTIAEVYGLTSFKTKFNAKVAEGRIASQRVVLLKPQTYMNLSGRSVLEAAKFYKIPPEAVFVFHDELDLSPSVVKVKLGGGSGGHNGLKSIDQSFGNNYWRIRIGIGHPGIKDAVSGYVLSNFDREEEELLASLLGSMAKEVPSLLQSDPLSWPRKLT